MDLWDTVCRTFDEVCGTRLNQAFINIGKQHAEIQRQVKSRLPRRESDRRKHTLARHVDILSAVETRLSLLSMTYTKYIENNVSCFIPGKVLDELTRILRIVSNFNDAPRAHEFLQELRDISSMAMEHFEDKIAPSLKSGLASASPLSVAAAYKDSYPLDGLSSPYSSPYIDLHTPPKKADKNDIQLLQQQARVQNNCIMMCKQCIGELRKKVQNQGKQLCDHDKSHTDQRKINSETKQHVSNQHKKIAEQNKKILAQDKLITEQDKKIAEQDRKINILIAQLMPSQGDAGSTIGAQDLIANQLSFAALASIANKTTEAASKVSTTDVISSTTGQQMSAEKSNTIKVQVFATHGKPSSTASEASTSMVKPSTITKPSTVTKPSTFTKPSTITKPCTVTKPSATIAKESTTFLKPSIIAKPNIRFATASKSSATASKLSSTVTKQPATIATSSANGLKPTVAKSSLTDLNQSLSNTIPLTTQTPIVHVGLPDDDTVSDVQGSNRRSARISGKGQKRSHDTPPIGSAKRKKK